MRFSTFTKKKSKTRDNLDGKTPKIYNPWTVYAWLHLNKYTGAGGCPMMNGARKRQTSVFKGKISFLFYVLLPRQASFEMLPNPCLRICRTRSNYCHISTINLGDISS